MFEHSLRIRLNQSNADPEQAKVDKSKGKVDANSTNGSETDTTDGTESTLDGNETDAEDDPSDSDTLVDSGSSSDNDREKVDTQKEIGHIVGRINNLITSDLDTIDYSYTVILLGEPYCMNFSFPRSRLLHSVHCLPDSSLNLVPLRCSWLEVIFSQL